MNHSTRRYIPKQPPTIVDNIVYIPATRGMTALVDAIDIDLADHYWKATSKGYIRRGVWIRETKEIKQIELHGVILQRILGRELLDGEIPDHKDGNPLNNQRSNIRLADRLNNNRNAKLRSDNKAKLKGVDWHVKTQKWRARIRVNKKLIHLGLFESKELAHASYCEAAKEYFGEFARYE